MLKITNGAGNVFFYYRRGGRRIPLRGPEGSAAFLTDYRAAKALFQTDQGPATVAAAIAKYLASADFQSLAAGSKKDYRRTLDVMDDVGAAAMASLDAAWIDDLRTAYAAKPIQWNALRSRMIQVERLYRVHHKSKDRPWEDSRRLKEVKSRAHRPWPPAVLLAVMRAATPEFRALLTGYLLTAQRGGDVTAWRPEQYDAKAHTLTFKQEKTGEPMTLHVPASLAAVFDAMRGRDPQRLFVTPRGKRWTTINAQETLLTLRAFLKLERYTLHGLRATGPTALKMLGFENRALRALTGHTSDQNLETYLSGVADYQLAKPAQEALAAAFSSVLAEAEAGNARRFSGVTGRASSKAKEANANKVQTANILPKLSR